MNPIDAMKQALEAARLLGGTQAKKGFGCYTQEDARFERAMHEAIDKHTTVLRVAIEQAEKQEPVAWIINGDLDILKREGRRAVVLHTQPATFGIEAPLYTAPPQRQPLTEEEFDKIENRVYCRTREKGKPLGVYVRELCRAIERKHGIGGGE
jgi:hypothetical protein